MTNQEQFLLEVQDGLSGILKPYQQTLNQQQRMAEFILQCLRCLGRDDFLSLDELLRSSLAAEVRQEEALQGCGPLLDQLEKYANQKVDRYRVEFITDLEARAKEADLPLDVDFPRISFLKGIEGTVDFVGRSTTINKKTLKSIDPRRIIAAVQKIKRQLYDHPFDPRAFIDSLFLTYKTMVERESGKIGDPVPMQRFYLEHVLSIQSKPFFSDMDKGRFRGYSLDQLSVDFWRYFQSGTGGTSEGCALRLRPGRNNALWLLDQDGERRQITSISFLGAEK